jgi:hypothetical protein
MVMGEFKDLFGGRGGKCSGDDHGVMGSEGPGKWAGLGSVARFEARDKQIKWSDEVGWWSSFVSRMYVTCTWEVLAFLSAAGVHSLVYPNTRSMKDCSTACINYSTGFVVLNRTVIDLELVLF